MMRIILVFIMLAVLSGPAFAAGVGDKAPDLTVTTFSGETFDLAAQKGKVVLINFWAQWCPPCQVELPTIGRFYRHHKDQGLSVMAISLDKPRMHESARMLLGEYFLPGGMAGDMRTGFDPPNALPVTYVIDKKGVIRNVVMDELTIDDLNTIVLPLLAESQKQ
jgi:peroxiredoxin